MRRPSVLLACISVLFALSTAENCQWMSPDGNYFNLGALKYTGVKTFVDTAKKQTYYVSGCGPVTASLDPKCRSKLPGAGAAYQLTTSACFAIGNVNEVFFTPDGNTPTGTRFLQLFRGGEVGCSNQQRESVFQWSCDFTVSDFVLDNVQEVSPCTYKAFLRSRHACPTAGGPNEGLSRGWTFIIMFILVASAYVFGGMYYNQKKLGLTGIESVPHIEFWRELPGLVKDGCLYFNEHVLQPLITKYYRNRSYSTIGSESAPAPAAATPSA